MAAPWLKKHAARMLAAVAIVGAYGLTREPTISQAEAQALAGRFKFTQAELPAVAGEQRAIRPVHPSFKGHDAWISSVGAGVALHDLDQDGLPNDVCYVDTRTDQVVVAPVPGSPNRFTPFALQADAALFTRTTMAPMGCLPGDLNEDGLADLVVYYWGRTPLAFMRQAGQDLTAASYVANKIVDTDERWYTNAAIFADVDGDGHGDLIVGNYFPDNARVLDANATNREPMQDSMSLAFNGGVNRVLLWAGGAPGATKVSFKDVEGVFPTEIARAWTLSIGAQDLDGDLLPELYFGNDFGPDRLMHNISSPGLPRFALLQGELGFATPKSKVLGHDSFKGMGVDFADMNADGVSDIFVSNIADDFALMENNFLYLSTGETKPMTQGIAPYTDESEALGLARNGWSWDARLDDFDNDGVVEALEAAGFTKGTVSRWPELHELAMGNDQLLKVAGVWPKVTIGDDLSGDNHNPFFVRSASGKYYDLAHELGIDQPQLSRGIATADVDGDGRLDFALGNQWEASRFVRNESPTTNAFLGLHLRLPVGATVDQPTKVTAGHPSAGESYPATTATAKVWVPGAQTPLMRQVDHGNGHSGKRSPDLQFGLGQVAADAAIKVELAWRDAKGVRQTETLTLTPGWHTIVLGQSK